MRTWLPLLGRVAVTLLVAAVAAVVGWRLWDYEVNAPWTRDARVRADVVGIAPDVSGLVSLVMVQDNQRVVRGDVLFRIDEARFTLALQQAEANAANQKAKLEEAARELQRARSLTNAEISRQQQEQALAVAQEDSAAYAQAVADRDVAKLNLDRAAVTASVNGIITNFSMRPGDYVTAGTAVAALVDTDSIYVSAYFEETRLPRIHVGDAVTIRLLGNPHLLRGHVESISAGIADREREAGGLLANVNPTFSWVRLAQRVPVRIAIDSVPQGVTLIPGQTATVQVVEKR